MLFIVYLNAGWFISRLVVYPAYLLDDEVFI